MVASLVELLDRLFKEHLRVSREDRYEFRAPEDPGVAARAAAD